MPDQKNWKEEISANNSLFYLDLREMWNYRDLLFILMRRDFFAVYKQTILGPLWFFLQPILMTVTYVAIFARIGKFSTEGIPPVLFYLSGLVLWSYFSECILRTSTFLKNNSAMLSKVYFPRLIIPISLVLTNLIKFLIQLVVFFIVYGFFLLKGVVPWPNIYILLFPLLIILTAGLGMGAGIVVASITTRYKDLIHLLTFGIQLLMFVSPVLFPLSSLDRSPLRNVIRFNPMSGIIEAFRFSFFGKGQLNTGLLVYDTLFVVCILVVGIILFNSIEKSFVDSI